MLNRRSVLKGIGLSAGVIAVVKTAEIGSFAHAQAAQATPAPSGPFTLPALPYAYDALEPQIDAATMHLHHDKHHAGYVNNLNAAVAGHSDLAGKNVDELIANLDAVPVEVRTAVRNQGGGHANHSLWWQLLSKSGGAGPKGELAKDIDAQFGSFPQFQTNLTKAATGVFGSGWAWLTLTRDGKLQIESSANQDSPLSSGRKPILGIDVWEHAYYLKYQNRRPEYVSAFFQVINWEFVSSQYADAKKLLKA